MLSNSHRQLADLKFATFGKDASRQEAMAYDTCPREWSYQWESSAEQNLSQEKKVPPEPFGVEGMMLG